MRHNRRNKIVQIEGGLDMFVGETGEPALTAEVAHRAVVDPLFQSEHLSVLVGFGLTHALHRMATDNSLPGMDLATFGSFGNEITAEAKAFC